MTAPLLTKAVTITPNVRNTYVSLVDMSSWWFYNNHVAIKAKWTLKWTCDGTTGPANSGDATDRLTDKTKCATRATIAGAAQSYAVYSNVDGVQMKITFQGATDDVLKIGYSRAAGYTLAGTTTQEPTATDEVSSSALTVIGTGTSLDRVMSIWVRDDGRAWYCDIFRSGTLQSSIGCEQVISLCTVRVTNPIFDVPYCLYHYASVVRATSQGTPVGGINATPATQVGCQIRCYTDSARTIAIGSGDINLGATAGNAAAIGGSFSADKPAAQDGAASPLLPIYWSGARGANIDGLYATPIDWWCCYTSALTTPAAGDPFSGYDPGDDTNGAPRANWLVATGSARVRPWRNIAASLSTS
jgi:hypothetical protein